MLFSFLSIGLTAALDQVHHTVLLMFIPGILALVFAIAERSRVRDVLGLSHGRRRGWALAGALPIAVAVLTVAFGLASSQITPNPAFVVRPGSWIFSLLVQSALAFGEELGWRGYLHTQTRSMRHGPLWVGLVWAGWHMPWMLKEATHAYSVPLFILSVVIVAFGLAWIREVGQSVIPCAFFHGFWNCLRGNVLFGKKESSTPVAFISTDLALTDLEGVLGVVSSVLIMGVLVRQWYATRVRRDVRGLPCE